MGGKTQNFRSKCIFSMLLSRVEILQIAKLRNIDESFCCEFVGEKGTHISHVNCETSCDELMDFQL